MSFLSGSTRTFKQPEPKLLGLDSDRTSTAEEGRPVPWLCGAQRVGVTFLSQAFDQEAEEVTEDVPKKSEDITTGYNYFCSFAALVCGGPVDFLKEIYLDGQKVWNGVIQRGVHGTDFADVTIFGFGDVRIYFGTETQEIDPELAKLAEANPNGVIEEHPAYRGQCYLVFKRLFLGYQRTSVPQIEVVVARYPAPIWMLEPAEVQGDMNPVAAVIEALLNERFGLGLPLSRLDTVVLDFTASLLGLEQAGLSPLVTRRQPFRQVLVEMSEYFDMFYYGGADGKFRLGVVRTLVPNDGTVALDESALTEPPRLRPAGWESTDNLVQVVFHNKERGYKEDVAKGDDLANLQIVQEPRPVTLQRTWVTRPQVAFQMAYAAARSMGQPGLSGTVTVRKGQIFNLDVGKPFILNYAQLGLCHLPLRITEMHWPSPDRAVVEISFKAEWGAMNQTYAPPNVPEPPTPVVGEPEPFMHEAILELPFLAGSGVRPKTGWVQFLAARPNKQTSRFKAHFEKAPDSFESVQTLTRFAYHGVVTELWLPDGTTVQEAAALQVYIDSLDHDLPAVDLAGATANRLMLWHPNSQLRDQAFVSVFDAELVTDDVPSGSLVVGREYVVVGGQSITHDGVELAAGKTFVATATDYTETLGTEEVRSTRTYRMKGIVNRLDSKVPALAGGAEVWLIPRGVLAPFNLRSEALNQTYKLQPFVYGEGLDLAECAELDLTVQNRSSKPGKPINLRVGGERANAKYGAGGLSITWSTGTLEREGFFSQWNGFEQEPAETLLHFAPNDEVGTQFSHVAAAGETSYNLPAADITTHFGTLKDVRVTAQHKRGNHLSVHFEQLLVRYIP